MANLRRRKLLIIAYHFPPIQGSTGTSRTVAFSRYLRDLGWDVSVLTIDPKAYESTSEINQSLVADHVKVNRAWGRDSRRHFSVYGKYPGFLAVPDRWQSWIAGGYHAGLKTTKDWAPDVIMSTYPIPSAHVLGHILSKKLRKPWVAEFRDPMLQDNYPSTKLERWSYGKIEDAVFRNSSAVVVTTDNCRKKYAERFPDYGPERITTISNGYDPMIFSGLDRMAPELHEGKTVLLHSGVLYPHERDPAAFFSAISSLHRLGWFDDRNIEFRFRASGNEKQYSTQVKKLGIDNLVTFAPRVSYQEAVREMLSVDALMIFQADNCNDQIPAKIYEYMHASRPILGFADPDGETGQLLYQSGVTSIAKLEDPAAIESTVIKFVSELESGTAYLVPKSISEKYSRKSLTSKLAMVLESLRPKGDASS